jgi:hypothetical protein
LNYVSAEDAGQEGQENVVAQPAINPEAKTVKLAPATLDDLVSAQNRTTHAVRSLAVFFFMNLLWTAIVASLIGLAGSIPVDVRCVYDYCSRDSNPGAIIIYIFAGIVALIGIIATIGAAIRELRASRINETWM